MHRLARLRGVLRTRPELSGQAPEPPAPVALAPAAPWQIDVRRWPALARTQITLSGEADAEACEALERAVERARSHGDAVSLDLGHCTLPSTGRPSPSS